MSSNRESGCFGKFVIVCGLLILVLAVLISRRLEELTIPGHVFRVKQTRTFTGPLAPKFVVGKVEYLAHEEIAGPESFVLRQDEIFTSSHTCESIRLKAGKVVQRFPFIPNKAYGHCAGGLHNSTDLCCYPVGMRHWHDEVFLLADGVLGLLKINYKTETVEQLVSSWTILGGYPYMFIDDLTLIDNNTAIATDLTPLCGPSRFAHCVILDSQDSRLLKIDLRTGHVSVLLDKQSMMNGVQKHHDNESVLIQQTVYARVLRFFYRGKKRGRLEVFVDGLPGCPDNIRVSSTGTTYWVALYGSVTSGETLSIHRMAHSLSLRRFFLAVLDLFPKSVAEFISHSGFSKNNVMIELDGDGKIIRSIHDAEGRMPKSTEVQDDGEFLYVGSIRNHFIAKTKLP